MQRFCHGIFLLTTLWCVTASIRGQSSFVNFETAPIHPIALSPSGNSLIVCNLPDNRIEFFDLTGPDPIANGNMAVGLDPVALRFRTEEELWVVNHISDSVTILNPKTRRVMATLNTSNSPADVVFAGAPQKAFVSCSFPNIVQVFDPVQRQLIGNIAIAGDRPKAMAVDPSGQRVYIAVFESGNASTIISRELTPLTKVPGPTAVDFRDGPHGGINPPPNSSNEFNPPINGDLPSNLALPRVGVIVKKNSAGRWMDDNHGDWTEYIRGTNAIFTGRIAGWDLPDHDLAIIDTRSLDVSYVSGLMNICMNLAVNPATGGIAMIGTDGLNEVRFEPILQSIFTRVNIAYVDASLTNKNVRDLNPHLDYKKTTLPAAERNKSIGDPRGIVISSDGTRTYVTGMGSNNLLVLDANGNRIGDPIDLPDGPTGLALDEVRHRIYIACRLQSSIAVFNIATKSVEGILPLHDPTPQSIRAGRKIFYDTHQTSGLGQAACASCHVDGRVDRLAWDLGNPLGDAKDSITNRNFPRFPPTTTNQFHPMKGPMVTLTLQDIIGHEPFHWRGDKDGIEDFNSTFQNLQGRESEISAAEMKDFKAFLATIHFPPNPFRTISNTLPASLILTGHVSLGRGGSPRGTPLPRCNPARGLTLFRDGTALCITCHTLPSGLAADMRFTNHWISIPTGPNDVHHLGMVALERSSFLPFKVAQLRSLPEKVGFDLTRATGNSGFGFFHDGSVDSLTRFIQDGFNITSDQDAADLIGFLLAFRGSDLPAGSLTDIDRAPGVSSADTHAAVGKQLMLTNATAPALFSTFISLAGASNSRVELIAKGWKDGVPRGWLYKSFAHQFQSDRKNESYSAVQVQQLANANEPITLTLVPTGSGPRIGIDRDEDGVFDQDEIDAGSDPNSALSVPGNNAPKIAPVDNQTIPPGEILSFKVSASDPETGVNGLHFSLAAPVPPGAAVDPATGLFTWNPTETLAGTNYALTVQVSDDGVPPLTNSIIFNVFVKSSSSVRISQIQTLGNRIEIRWVSVPGKAYRLLAADNLESGNWQSIGNDIVANSTETIGRDASNHRSYRYYRILQQP